MFYIVGHKNPDTDSICSAIAYGYFLSQKGTEAAACRAGAVNPETKFVLEKFDFPEPLLLENGEGKDLVLVDHNEKEQRIAGEGRIIEVLDHHKINFVSAESLGFCVKPLGATATLVAEKFFQENIAMPPNIACILLASILSDTAIFRSPTTAATDRAIAAKLNEKLNFNLEEFGKEIKKAGMDLKQPAEKLLLRDSKEYVFAAKKFLISQIEIMEVEKFLSERKIEILSAMRGIKEEKGFDCFVFAATDIFQEGSEFFVFGEEEKVARIFNVHLKDNSVWLPGLMSRKKQIVPVLEKNFG